MFRIVVFSATLSNIAAISWRSVLLVEYRCRIVNLPHSKPSPSEYLLYSKPSPRIFYYIIHIPPGKLYDIANIPPSIADHPPPPPPPPDIFLYSKCSPLIRIITIDSEFNTLIVLISIVIYH